MSSKSVKKHLVYLFYLTLLLGGCKCKKDAVFSGWVVDQKGKAISKALVKVNDDVIQTSDDGRFELGVNKANEFLITVKHAGHADLHHMSRSPLKDQVWVLPDATVKEVDPTTTVTLVDDKIGRAHV